MFAQTSTNKDECTVIFLPCVTPLDDKAGISELVCTNPLERQVRVTTSAKSTCEATRQSSSNNKPQKKNKKIDLHSQTSPLRRQLGHHMPTAQCHHSLWVVFSGGPPFHELECPQFVVCNGSKSFHAMVFTASNLKGRETH